MRKSQQIDIPPFQALSKQLITIVKTSLLGVEQINSIFYFLQIAGELLKGIRIMIGQIYFLFTIESDAKVQLVITIH